VETDDLSIKDCWRLLRRIPVNIDGVSPWIIWSENLKAWIPTSAAFQGHKTNRRAFSVHLEPVLTEHGLTHDSVVLDRDKFALAAFTAGQARAQRQVIERNPLPGDPAHANLLGDKSGSIKKNLRDCSVWVIAPTLPPPAAA
jgi:hypothetical protein